MVGHRFWAVVAVLGAMLLAVLSPALATQGAKALQPVPGLSDGIVVTGLGTASGPPSAASVHVMIGSDQYGAMMPTAITEADLAPIIAAITAAGVAEDEIEVTIPATNSMFMGPGGSGSALLRFEIADPTQSGLAELVQSLYEAATEARLGVQHIGARYLSDDCVTLLQEASDAAVADARVRAERLARAVGVGLGQLTQAAEFAYFEPAGQSSCAPTPPPGYGGFGSGLDQPFDATLPAEATVYAQITLTFAMAEPGEATPVAGRSRES